MAFSVILEKVEPTRQTKIKAMESRKGVSRKSALASPTELYFAAWLEINYYTTFTLPQFIKPFLGRRRSAVGT